MHCIVEGPTEVAVFNAILTPYLLEKAGTYVEIIITPIKHTGGGIVKFPILQRELRSHLLDTEKIVTTFFDYYGIHKGHKFPNYKEAKELQKNSAIGAKLLEQGMEQHLSQQLNLNTRNFSPYIQVHEFEALLFSSDEGFEFQYDDPRILDELKRVRNRFPNPEDINDSPQTAPSKRLKTVLEKYDIKYDKVTDGRVIAKKIGIETIMEKCPGFRQWVETLVAKI